MNPKIRNCYKPVIGMESEPSCGSCVNSIRRAKTLQQQNKQIRHCIQAGFKALGYDFSFGTDIVTVWKYHAEHGIPGPPTALERVTKSKKEAESCDTPTA